MARLVIDVIVLPFGMVCPSRTSGVKLQSAALAAELSSAKVRSVFEFMVEVWRWRPGEAVILDLVQNPRYPRMIRTEADHPAANYLAVLGAWAAP